jgi:Zn-dependent protease
MTCSQCGGEIAPALLACPACHALVHGAELRRLAAEAGDASARSDTEGALRAWRSALALLPPQTRQHLEISQKIDALSRQVTAGSLGGWRRTSAGGGIVVGAALLLWKLKTVLLIALSKGKFLLLGLGKSTTLLSMIPTFALYWAAFGWPFAAGLVLSIYVHEIGHVVALTRYGIAASAPMFIPGVGAVVRSSHYPANAHEDARIGLAGPVWGLGAALAAFAVFGMTAAPAWGAIARVGAWINLFNLLPVWQLDGARAFRPLSRSQRVLATVVVAAAFARTREGLLVLIALAAAYQAFRADESSTGDWGALGWYAGLVAALTWMTRLGPAGLA